MCRSRRTFPQVYKEGRHFQRDISPINELDRYCAPHRPHDISVNVNTARTAVWVQPNNSVHSWP